MSLAQAGFMKDDYNKTRRWLKLGVHIKSDHLYPTSPRIICLSTVWRAGHWHEVRVALDVCLSVVPWSIPSKQFLKSRFNSNAEPKTIEAMEDFISSRTQLLYRVESDSDSSVSVEDPTDLHFDDLGDGPWLLAQNDLDTYQPIIPSSSSSSRFAPVQPTRTYRVVDMPRVAPSPPGDFACP